ncbi:MAG TPA: hypothetical protein VG939_09545, partial [Caulobacteraceae bacterium]|nr:hypothetical protein [Caulobacteraceae bacterium]
MASWDRVRWTEAGQIAELLGWPAPSPEDGRSPPQAFFARLRADGRLHDAAFFLGQALPRFETVAWAAGTVRSFKPAGQDRDEALDAALAWLNDPSEANRRTAYEAAGRAPQASPGRLAALAAFFSGGSMSPEGQPPVPAPRDAAGRFAAGAVLLASIQSSDQTASLTHALDQGETLAAKGA